MTLLTGKFESSRIRGPAQLRWLSLMSGTMFDVSRSSRRTSDGVGRGEGWGRGDADGARTGAGSTTAHPDVY